MEFCFLFPPCISEVKGQGLVGVGLNFGLLGERAHVKGHSEFGKGGEFDG